MASGLTEAEVIVVGAGPAGLAAALACHKRGLDCRVIETSKAASAEAAKGRSAALFNRTVAFLQWLGIWAECAKAAEPLKKLQFIDDTGRRLRAPDCFFDAAEIGEEAFGYNITNADLTAVLNAEAEKHGLQPLPAGPLAGFRLGNSCACVSFNDGTSLCAPLVIAADGRGSAVRTAVNIRTLTWSYDQIAIAASFSHDRPHRGICIELHRRAGPFTLVPLPGNNSSLVWVETKSEAERLLALDDAEFARRIEEISRLALGRVNNLSPMAKFPLSALAARQYGKSRVALVGEAAHAVPPIGAQGLNLGFRDVEVLVRLIGSAKDRGEDIGSDGLLRAYSA
ncbi:MAG TPA: FAD-dependent oxidoreductase, partial [Hyphomicrobiales bacterium]|nr:FAD-dependent oxidoreductase [Hyphomicrobiales bacterium]